MDTTVVTSVMYDALIVALKLCGPLLLLSMVVGILVALFQAVTQIHEQTLGFILKLAVIVTVLLIGGNWMMETLRDYAREVFALMLA